MNKLLLLLVALLSAAILVVFGVVLGAKLRTPSSQIVLDTIATRTSIRAYQAKSVDADTVEKILRAASAAPSASNRQPWEFIVVDRPELLKALAKALPHAKMVESAPMAIVVCGNSDRFYKDEGQLYWVEDASAATQNLLLAAHALGLGAVWTGVFPLSERVRNVSNILMLPSNIVPLNVIPLGYPAETPAPKDKWTPARVHKNHF